VAVGVAFVALKGGFLGRRRRRRRRRSAAVVVA
jgi:hypothetical protein